MKKSAKMEVAPKQLKPKKDTRFTLNLPYEVKEKLYQEAVDRGETASEIVFRLILNHQKSLNK